MTTQAEPMTDEEIVRAVLEKVMGGIPLFCPAHPLSQSDPQRARISDWSEWNPLTSDADACAVLRKLSHLHPDVSYDDTLCGWTAEFMTNHDSRAFAEGLIEGFGRAICLAALKAVE